MKKQIAKLSIKTDKIVSLSKTDAANILGGRPKTNGGGCWSFNATCSESQAVCCSWQC
ncbi:class I lanthipeptide [Fibrisoma limi]|uniref:class I lanthipeptide n=1 Tax=Fibrisoma limi TaxID=663275 RepID=UPI001788BA97